MGQAPLEVVGGPTNVSDVLDDRRGGYVLLYHQNRADTLWTWVQHVGPDAEPDYESARHAGLVIWCHPDRYPHPNHVLPEATGKIEIARSGAQLWVREVP